MQMYYKKDNAFVEAYNFFENGTVLIFSPSLQGSRGNGWERVKNSQLIPMEYFDPAAVKGFMSKTEKNKIKKRLTLTKAEWTCTDGKIFYDCEEAIAHEKELMEEEMNNA